MPTFSFTKSYQDDVDLTEQQLDDGFESVEDFLNTTKIDADNIQNAAITNPLIATGAVDSNEIAADAVINTKIAADAVQTSQIQDSAVTTPKINDGDVTTAKLNDNAVTRAKQEAVGQQISSSSGSFSTSNGSLTDVTNLSVTLTTTGRPVILAIISDGSGSNCSIGGSAGGGNSERSRVNIAFLRDASQIAKYDIFFDADGLTDSKVPGGIFHIDTPSSGTYTYKVQASVVNANSVEVLNAKLIAYEL